jgi:hypothetical protein
MALACAIRSSFLQLPDVNGEPSDASPAHHVISFFCEPSPHCFASVFVFSVFRAAVGPTKDGLAVAAARLGAWRSASRGYYCLMFRSERLLGVL